MICLKESITLLALVVAVLLPIIPPPFWFLNNWQFILMAIIPVAYFTYLFLRKNEIPVRIEKADVGWLIFIGISFLSYFWSTNGGLVWYPAFGWLCLIMWMLLFRSLTPRDTSSSFMPMLFSVFFLIIMVYHIYAIGANVQLLDGSWNHTVFSLAILFVLFITDAQWATFAFLLVLVYYSWTNLPRSQFWNSFVGFLITAVLVGVMGFLNPDFLQKIPIIKQCATVAGHFKFYLIKASLFAFGENPILGVGLGNWHLHAYQTDFSYIGEFNDPKAFIRYRSHNMYTQQLVELGIIGFGAFLYSIGNIIRRSLSFKRTLDGYEQAAFASLMVYLFTAFFYADINFYKYHFSGIHLLAFCALGILSSKNSETFYWFGYAKYSYDVFFETQKQLSIQDPSISIEALENIYHPVFQTNHNYKKSVSFELAKLYQQTGEFDKATNWFQTAIKENPTDAKIRLAYATFLWKVEKNPKGAQDLALDIYKSQKNHFELNLLLAELAIANQQYDNQSYGTANFWDAP